MIIFPLLRVPKAKNAHRANSGRKLYRKVQLCADSGDSFHTRMAEIRAFICSSVGIERGNRISFRIQLQDFPRALISSACSLRSLFSLFLSFSRALGESFQTFLLTLSYHLLLTCSTVWNRCSRFPCFTFESRESDGKLQVPLHWRNVWSEMVMGWTMERVTHSTEKAFFFLSVEQHGDVINLMWSASTAQEASLQVHRAAIRIHNPWCAAVPPRPRADTELTAY